MLRLSDNERLQFKQTWRLDSGKLERPIVRTAKEYVAFATFAASFSRVRPPRLIRGGDHWRL
jgi:hypothetical protein